MKCSTGAWVGGPHTRSMQSLNRKKSESRRLCAPAALNFDKNVNQRNRCRRYAWNPRRMRQGAWPDFQKRLLHLARQSADGRVIEPLWNRALFSLFQSLDSPVLLQQIAFVLYFSFDRLKFIPHRGRKTLPEFVVTSLRDE